MPAAAPPNTSRATPARMSVKPRPFFAAGSCRFRPDFGCGVRELFGKFGDAPIGTSSSPNEPHTPSVVSADELRKDGVCPDCMMVDDPGCTCPRALTSGTGELMVRGAPALPGRTPPPAPVIAGESCGISRSAGGAIGVAAHGVRAVIMSDGNA